MQQYLSSRMPRVALRSVISAAAVLLTVVTPVTVAHAEPATPAAPGQATAVTAGVTTNVQLSGDLAFGERANVIATFTNGTGAALSGQKGLITVAYGRHVDARLKPMTADPSKIVVERLNDGVRERLSLVRGADGTVRATFPLPEGLAPGATAVQRFLVTLHSSVPADANMGEIGVAGRADGTGADRVGFSLPERDARSGVDVVIGGIDGRPELVAGGKPVRFTAKVTNNTGADQGDDFFFITGKSTADLDPQHVTLERRDASGAWVPVSLGEQDQAVLGTLDRTPLKSGASRTYELRLGVSKFLPTKIVGGQFLLFNGNFKESLDFTVKHRAPAVDAPDVNRTLSVTTGLKGVTHLKTGGAPKEFTVTVTNRGNITQDVDAVFEVADKNLKRRMAAARSASSSTSPLPAGVTRSSPPPPGPAALSGRPSSPAPRSSRPARAAPTSCGSPPRAPCGRRRSPSPSRPSPSAPRPVSACPSPSPAPPREPAAPPPRPAPPHRPRPPPPARRRARPAAGPPPPPTPPPTGPPPRARWRRPAATPPCPSRSAPAACSSRVVRPPY
ncbi:hypothetical protein [Streptomyces sp. CC210A]|uniref:hypothetical protein n=1 Tax=Streptomyces sp. CC210A TaxID=2898184 RepID=UPI001F1F47E9|nr:hypothetical protein [Streptomyces sp. CC210A]